MLPVTDSELVTLAVAQALLGFRAVATRFDKRAYVFHGTATAASIRLRLHSRSTG